MSTLNQNNIKRSTRISMNALDATKQKTIITRKRGKKRAHEDENTAKSEEILAAAEEIISTIKMEDLENDNEKNNNKTIDSGDIIDIKPDINVLNQNMLLQIQQPQQQQPQLILVANPNNLLLTTETTTNLIQFKPTTTTLTKTIPSVLSNMSEFTISEEYEKDDIDLQTSDSDEDGYSDLDLEENDEYIEDDDDNDIYDPVWFDQQTEKRKVFTFDLPFTEWGMIGKPRIRDPLYYFKAVLGDHEHFFNNLAQSCNKRAQKLMQNTNVGHMYLKQITAQEMKIFFGLCLEMSTLKLPNIWDYWHEKAFSSFQGYSTLMSLNRFQLLLRTLNFEQFNLNIKTNQTNENFEDLQQLLTLFNERMSNIYRCGQRLVLCDPIVFWKGHLHWHWQLSNKKRSNALNLHFLTENNGLILRIVTELEKSTIVGSSFNKNSRDLVTKRIEIAKELLENKLNSGRVIYASKYYGSYGLTYELSCEATYCTGFLEKQRYGNSKQLILKPLKLQNYDIKYAGAIMMSTCRRKQKNIYFISSDCLAINARESTNRNGDTRIKIIKELDWQLNRPKEITKALMQYQLFVNNQEIKWDRILMIYIFNLFVLNAYLLYKQYAPNACGRSKDTAHIVPLKNYAEFRQIITKSLLPDSTKETTTTTTTIKQVDSSMHKNLNSRATNISYMQINQHVPLIIPQKNNKIIKKRCRICCKAGLISLTKYYCKSCVNAPGLCETPCFKLWHDLYKIK